MKDNSNLWLGIRKSLKLYEQMLKGVCIQYQLTGIEADVISFLQHNPGKDSAMDMVELRLLSKGSISKAVEGLIQKSILRRHQDVEDRRVIHLELLPDAEPILDSIEKVQQRFWEIVFSGFTAEELSLYESFNRRILNNTLTAIERNRLL